eukprot:scaffold44990_cov19-Tisochrysis_lutea.AAC.1
MSYAALIRVGGLFFWRTCFWLMSYAAPICVGGLCLWRKCFWLMAHAALMKGLLGNAVPLEGLSLPDISAHDVSVVFDGPAHAGNEEARLTAEAEWEPASPSHCHNLPLPAMPCPSNSPSPTLGKPGNRATMTTRDTVTSGTSFAATSNYVWGLVTNDCNASPQSTKLVHSAFHPGPLCGNLTRSST